MTHSPLLLAAPLTANQYIQYAIVALIILAALTWLIWSIRRKNRNKSGSCCGCALANTCRDTPKNKPTNCRPR